MMKQSTMKWLLDSDPSIRWQVLRDLAGADPSMVSEERAKITTKGWGASLLAQQTEQGWFAGDDQSLLRTIHCLALLKKFGIDPEDPKVKAMIAKVETLRWEYHGSTRFFEGEVEPCMNGKVLEIGSYFGIKCDSVLERLLNEQLEDGGWNCEAPASSKSSFHSTIAVLEGLLAFDKRFGASARSFEARLRAEEYLLKRRLFKRLTTGEIISQTWTRFHFPMTWHYDLLWGLDYFSEAGRPYDERMQEAIDIVRLRCHQNGRWPIGKPYKEDLLMFDMETKTGTASRWNTLRALRVLNAYELRLP